MTINSTKILGVRVDLVDMEQTLEIIEEFIHSRKVHQIVVVNVAKIVKAIHDQKLKNILGQAALSGADGMPVVWVSRLFGHPIPGRVNGTDLMNKLVELSAKKGYRIFFFGARPEVVKRVVTIYSELYPSLEIAGYHHGYFEQKDEEAIANMIRNSNADILFVAFGSPKKEKFIDKYKEIMNVPVIHGVGGSFDVVAGVTKRAPLWMQQSGLEWLYRFLQEPKRMWRRYLITNTLFIYYLLLYIIKIKKFE